MWIPPVPEDDATGDVAHVHEPRLAEVGLDDGLGPVRVVDLELAVLDPVEQVQRVEVLQHLRARLDLDGLAEDELLFDTGC